VRCCEIIQSKVSQFYFILLPESKFKFKVKVKVEIMKVLALFTLLIASANGQTKETIRTLLRNTHQDSMYDGQVIKQPFAPGSYQLAAREEAATRYASTGASNDVIKNYYALRCIYESTNGKSNPRAQFDEIPNWKVATGWSDDVSVDTASDYCTWHGITCENSLVTGIKLNNNTLYGTWPVEVAFLGETLESIDLYYNYFHYCENYQWFKSMKVLNYLFFGTTSWDSNGIPSVLKLLDSIFELDFSNTFWRGYLNPDAWTGTPNLYYVDMGNNFYSFLSLTSIPESLYSKNIIRLFMDNIKITDNGQLNLDFVGKMPIILEFWADFTKFTGGIPASIGEAGSLKSLSLTYCGLTGAIPATLVNTDIERMWLFANKLTGSFPSVLATKKWKYLFIEENDITGSFSTGICSQVGTTDDTLQGLGADCEICTGVSGNNPTGGDCCTCCGGDGCGNLEEVTPAPTAAPTGFGGFCFSGDSEVDVENTGLVKMADLAIGDAVKVADNTFEPVYSFGHKSADASSEFLQIATEGNRKALELSKDHMVVIEGGRNVPASSIKRGDKLVSSSGELVAVKTIRTVVRQGAYAPFTASGSIIVNDVVASNYIAFQGAEYLKVSGVETPFSYQWLAHIFNSVHRVAYKMGVTGETYTEGGVSQWVDLPNKAGTWLLEQSFVIALGLLLPSIAFFGFVSIIEAVMKSPVALAAFFIGSLCLLSARRSVSIRMPKKV